MSELHSATNKFEGKFTLRRYEGVNYKLISEWWEARKFPPPHQHQLPPTGVLLFFEDQPLACGFLLKTDANQAVICHLVSNPSAPKILRQPGVNAVVEFLFNKAVEECFSIVFISTNIKKLQERYKQLGFTLLDENVNIYGRAT